MNPVIDVCPLCYAVMTHESTNPLKVGLTSIYKALLIQDIPHNNGAYLGVIQPEYGLPHQATKPAGHPQQFQLGDSVLGNMLSVHEGSSPAQNLLQNCIDLETDCQQPPAFDFHINLSCIVCKTFTVV